MQGLRKALKSIGPLRRAVLRARLRRGVHGQSNEGEILRELATRTAAPKTFVEFGFHVAEFNCAGLVGDFDGLLIDGDAHQIEDARLTIPAHIRVEQRFLTRDNLDFIRESFPALGILSIDVDGNDYWFLEALIGISPSIICVEYNASFGLEPVTVPYDPEFDRAAKHPSGWYHGASLTALDSLARQHGYGLAAVSTGGGNAFFTRDGALVAEEAWLPSALRDQWSGTTAAQQWDALKGCEFVRV